MRMIIIDAINSILFIDTYNLLDMGQIKARYFRAWGEIKGHSKSVRRPRNEQNNALLIMNV